MAWPSLVRLGVEQPIAEPVPSDDAFFLRSKGTARIAWRTARRMLQLRLGGQLPLLQERFDPRWTRALWIHAEAPQIGDALMDLAPRSLLAERGIAVDLLAPAATVGLFAGDPWLRRSFADPAEIDPASVDVVIATSHSAESLAAKRRHAPRLPWVSLKGYYAAYDYHRGGFVARRLAGLMCTELDAAAYAFHSRQKLAPRDGVANGRAAAVHADGGPAVAIAVGGVRAERTYAQWPAVVALLQRGGVRRVVLVGSDNGRAAAARIAAAAAATPGLIIDDRTGRLDLHATRSVIAASALLLCADGGLMHLGLTTPTPLLALFTQAIDPAWRLPLDVDGAALRAAGADVSAIPPAQVAAEALRLLARQPPPSQPRDDAALRPAPPRA